MTLRASNPAPLCAQLQRVDSQRVQTVMCMLPPGQHGNQEGVRHGELPPLQTALVPMTDTPAPTQETQSSPLPPQWTCDGDFPPSPLTPSHPGTLALAPSLPGLSVLPCCLTLPLNSAPAPPFHLNSLGNPRIWFQGLGRGGGLPQYVPANPSLLPTIPL